jgi:hypothetical protein
MIMLISLGLRTWKFNRNSIVLFYPSSEFEMFSASDRDTIFNQEHLVRGMTLRTLSIQPSSSSHHICHR